MIQSENSNTLPVDADQGQNVSGTISNVDARLTPSDSPDVHGWQPIETAPKDGTPVFLIIAGSVCLPWADYWYLEEGFWIYYHQTQEYVDRPIEPTHWMPIPPVLP